MAPQRNEYLDVLEQFAAIVGIETKDARGYAKLLALTGEGSARPVHVLAPKMGMPSDVCSQILAKLKDVGLALEDETHEWSAVELPDFVEKWDSALQTQEAVIRQQRDFMERSAPVLKEALDAFQKDIVTASYFDYVAGMEMFSSVAGREIDGIQTSVDMVVPGFFTEGGLQSFLEGLEKAVEEKQDIQVRVLMSLQALDQHFDYVRERVQSWISRRIYDRIHLKVLDRALLRPVGFAIVDRRVVFFGLIGGSDIMVRASREDYVARFADHFEELYGFEDRHVSGAQFAWKIRPELESPPTPEEERGA